MNGPCHTMEHAWVLPSGGPLSLETLERVESDSLRSHPAPVPAAPLEDEKWRGGCDGVQALRLTSSLEPCYDSVLKTQATPCGTNWLLSSCVLLGGCSDFVLMKMDSLSY